MRFKVYVVCAIVIGGVAEIAQASPFNLVQMALFNNATDTFFGPSSGSFITQRAIPGEENTFLTGSLALGGQITVQNTAQVWRADFDGVMASTWLATDRYGPRGIDGTDEYGNGWSKVRTLPGGSTVPVPEGNTSIGGPGLMANGINGDPVNGDGLSPGFAATASGFAWHNELGSPDLTPSGHTVINGQRFTSLFVGHFVLSDPDATLVGDNLLAFFSDDSPGPEASLIYELPLDGSRASNFFGTEQDLPFWLEYERTTFTNSLGTFTALDMYLVPSPGAGSWMLFLGGTWVRARRRK